MVTKNDRMNEKREREREKKIKRGTEMWEIKNEMARKNIKRMNKRKRELQKRIRSRVTKEKR